MTAVLAVLLAALSVPPTPPKFSSSIEMVNLQITVQDPQGRYITTLAEKDFNIFESGAKQDIASFSYKKLPLDLTFLLDGSDSMGPYSKDVYTAVARFVDTVKPDTVQIAQFSHVVRTVMSPTDDMNETQRSLATLALFAEQGYRMRTDKAKSDSTKPEDIVYREALQEWLCRRAMCGGTALYTSIYAISEFLAKLPTDQADERRQVVIVLTDGDDTSSSLTTDDVLKEVSKLEIPIYAVCLRPEPPFRDPAQTDEFLRSITKATGGEYRIVRVIRELDVWYKHIATELQSQYHIRYASSTTLHNGQWRPIQVSVGQPGYVLGHKEGYFAPCDPDQPCATAKKQ